MRNLHFQVHAQLPVLEANPPVWRASLLLSEEVNQLVLLVVVLEKVLVAHHAVGDFTVPDRLFKEVGSKSLVAGEAAAGAEVTE